MAPLPRLLALPLAVALLAATGCRSRCAPGCPRAVAQAGPADTVGALSAASPEPPLEPAVVVGDSDAVKRYYGVPVRSDSVLFVIGPPYGERLVWSKHGQIFESGHCQELWIGA